MFSTLKILVIYLIIPSRCTCIPTTPTSNDKTTTQSVGEKVKEEMNDFNEILNQIKDDQIRFYLKGKLEEVLKRAINLDQKISEKDQKISEKDQKIGNLDTQLKIFSKILRILGVRSRAETLVDDLYPGGRKPHHTGVAKAYEEILTSTKPEFEERSCIKIFRQRVLSYGISTANFVDAIRSIYGSLSDKAAHKMSAFEPSPPKYNDTRGIEEMFEEYGITPDEVKVKTAQIILEPLPLSSTPDF